MSPLTGTFAVTLLALITGTNARNGGLDGRYSVKIEEHGTLLREELEIRGDVHIYRVPAHNDLQAVTVVLDYQKGLKISHVPSEKQCYLTTLAEAKPDPYQQRRALRKFSRSLLHSENTREFSFGIVRASEPLEDVSFLPHEARDICNGLPVIWSYAVDIRNATQGRIFVKTNPQTQLEHSKTRVKRLAAGMCPGQDFYQFCSPNVDSSRACFYVLKCPSVDSSNRCLEHIRTIDVVCKACCNNPSYEGHDRLPHCDAYGGVEDMGNDEGIPLLL